MAFEGDLVARLEAVANGIGMSASISWFEFPRGTWVRGALITPAGEGELWTHGGLNALSEPRIQIDWWAAKQSDALALWRATKAELQRSDPVTIGETVFMPPAVLNVKFFDVEEIGGSSGTPGRKMYRATQDFSLFIQPAA